jgi:hypothetical protein
MLRGRRVAAILRGQRVAAIPRAVAGGSVGDNAKQNEQLAEVARPAELLAAKRLTRSARGQGCGEAEFRYGSWQR